MGKIQAKRRYRINRIIRLRRLRNRLKKLLNTLPLSGLFELYESQSDERLQKKVEQKIIDIAAGEDDLLEIIIHGPESLRVRLWSRLKSKIQGGQIIKNKARQILKEIIKSVSKLRKDAWKLYKTLDPTDKELKEIQTFDFIYSLPSIAYEIEQMLRKKPKRKKNRIAKTIQRILEITEKINKLKKGQA